MIKPRTEL